MKSRSLLASSAASLLLLITMTAAAQAAVLFGFYDFDSTQAAEGHDVAATGFTATMTKNTDARTQGGSDDEFYGNSSLTLPAVTGGDGFIRMIGGSFTITTAYTGVSAYSLESLYFDATTTTMTGNLTVSYTINGGASVSLTPTALAMVNTTASDTVTQPYGDFGLAFSGASLNPGDTLTFTFNVTNGSARLDNFALTGSIVPEPATALLLPAIGLLSLRRQRR